jgi:hypothetical protein
VLGVAVFTTVAVSRSADYLAANEGVNPLVVLTEGFQSAFVACGVLAAIGVALAVVLLGQPPEGSAGAAGAAPGDRRCRMRRGGRVQRTIEETAHRNDGDHLFRKAPAIRPLDERGAKLL